MEKKFMQIFFPFVVLSLIISSHISCENDFFVEKQKLPQEESAYPKLDKIDNGAYIQAQYLGGNVILFKKDGKFFLHEDVVIPKDEIGHFTIIDNIDKYLDNLERSKLNDKSTFVLPKPIIGILYPLNYPYRHITYWVDPSFKSDDKTNIKSGIENYEIFTVLTFEEVSNESDANISFHLDESDGCYTEGLGYRKGKPRKIVLTSSCVALVPTIIHELGHALGRVHEFKRSDRDKHIILKPDTFKFLRDYYGEKYYQLLLTQINNMSRLPDIENKYSFDLGSIMMYNSYLKEEILVEKRMPIFTDINGNIIIRSKGLSDTDMKIINDRYHDVPYGRSTIYKALYKLSTEHFDDIFKSGFTSLGNNTALGDHITGKSILDKNSGFVSASSDKSKILDLLRQYKNRLEVKGITPPHKVYLYVLSASPKFFEIYRAAANLSDWGVFPNVLTNFIRSQSEWAVKSKISFHDVHFAIEYQYSYTENKYVENGIIVNPSFKLKKISPVPITYDNFNINGKYINMIYGEGIGSADFIGKHHSDITYKSNELLYGPYTSYGSFEGFVVGQIDILFYASSNYNYVGRFKGIFAGLVFSALSIGRGNATFRRPLSTMIQQRESGVPFALIGGLSVSRFTISRDTYLYGPLMLYGLSANLSVGGLDGYFTPSKK